MRRKKDKSNGITALYERLSRDDDNAGESNSIVHQKQMLEDYAMKHGFTNLVHFTDDGWSGATFDRPSWNRLVEGVKNGEITACICKDMSRIGRDHLQVGFFTDILFREKEVRFIAINNGIPKHTVLAKRNLLCSTFAGNHTNYKKRCRKDTGWDGLIRLAGASPQKTRTYRLLSFFLPLFQAPNRVFEIPQTTH